MTAPRVEVAPENAPDIAPVRSQAAEPTFSTSRTIVVLQRTVGNRAVSQLIRRRTVGRAVGPDVQRVGAIITAPTKAGESAHQTLSPKCHQ